MQPVLPLPLFEKSGAKTLNYFLQPPQHEQSPQHSPFLNFLKVFIAAAIIITEMTTIRIMSIMFIYTTPNKTPPR